MLETLHETVHENQYLVTAAAPDAANENADSQDSFWYTQPRTWWERLQRYPETEVVSYFNTSTQKRETMQYSAKALIAERIADVKANKNTALEEYYESKIEKLETKIYELNAQIAHLNAKEYEFND